MNNTLKNLLAVNRKALQGLHAIADMDFQKPYTLIERDGKFTHNSIVKELGNIKIRDWNVFVLYVRPADKWNSQRAYIARVQNLDFEAQRHTIEGYEQANGWRYLDTVVGKADFEKNRKNVFGHYFIIAQPRDMENHRNREIAVADRFKTQTEYSKPYVIPYTTPIHDKSDWYYADMCAAVGKVDKSGYAINVNDYEYRVRKLKAERSEAQAASWNGTEVIRNFESRIATMKHLMTDALNVENPNYTGIANVAKQLSAATTTIKKLRENKFKSMDNIRLHIHWIEEYLTEAENSDM